MVPVVPGLCRNAAMVGSEGAVTEARRYMADRTCQFNHWFYCEPCQEYHNWTDRNRAKAVYVSDDSLQHAIYICMHCAVKAQREGDGPVLYPRGL